jgi:hypothetical protein
VEVNWNDQNISSELIIPDSNDLAEESS